MKIGTILSQQSKRKENICKHCGDTYFTLYFDITKVCSKEECQKKLHTIEVECSGCRKTHIIDDRNHSLICIKSFLPEYFCNQVCVDKLDQIIIQRRAKDEELKKEKQRNRGLPIKLTRINSDRKEILDQYENSMFITGGVGTGKTVLMASICKIYNSLGKETIWINYGQFLLDLYRSFNSKETYKLEERIFNIKQYGGITIDNVEPPSQILFIDDIGSEKLTDYSRSVLYNIINYYDENELNIFLSSNLTLSEISKNIDERISSRIAGMCKVVKLNGEDKRIK